MPFLEVDPWFFAAAIPAVLITGISKSGFSGGVGILAVPLIAVFVSPLQAAAVMLPILVVMDLITIWAYRRTWHKGNLIVLLPGAVLGVGVGWATFHWVDDNAVRLLLGVISIAFGLSYFAGGREAENPKTPPPWIGTVCGTISGFTSFVAHAGGAPVKVFLLPQRLDKTLFVGTNVIFFFAVNQLKLIPYGALGQFSTDNLALSAVLLPLAPLGVWLGLKLHHRVSEQLFYRICYGLVLISGCKLMWDGVLGSGWI